jgi:hypothetical protein
MPRLLSAIVIGLLVAACGASQPTTAPVITAAPTVAPTIAPAPTAASTTAPTPASTGAFDGLPYSLSLPEGWTTFDLSDPAGAAALDDFVEANPEMGAAIQAFKALPNVVMAVNMLIGNVVVTLSLPTGGLPLDSIASSFTSQFQAVPGVKDPPEPEEVTLTAGPAIHWRLAIEANAPAGGTFEVGESIYLIANDTDAVLVEFVEVGGGVPQEQQIIQSLRFNP